MKHNQSNIKKAQKYLDKNNCIGIPTETVYGLAGNAYSDIAVKKIFSLKKRPKNNPLIVHYLSLFQLEKKDDLKTSLDQYQELMRLNNIIEKKFQKKSKNIKQDMKEKIESITNKKNAK